VGKFGGSAFQGHVNRFFRNTIRANLSRIAGGEKREHTETPSDGCGHGPIVEIMEPLDQRFDPGFPGWHRAIVDGILKWPSPLLLSYPTTDKAHSGAFWIT
jgi:hypothetical protein